MFQAAVELFPGSCVTRSDRQVKSVQRLNLMRSVYYLEEKKSYPLLTRICMSIDIFASNICKLGILVIKSLISSSNFAVLQ